MAPNQSISEAATSPVDKRAAERLVAEHPLWYHTMELAPGVVTPGWFDLRGVVDSLPWPDVRGKRCLDVDPYDGFFSFELERRGAAEGLAVDIGSHEDWEWPPHATSGGSRPGRAHGRRGGHGVRYRQERPGLKRR